MSTYVMSDIHGQYDLFIKMLNKISFSKDDMLYIIGDVIDRGPDGCLLLSHIIKEDNIQMILGNHEAMMLDCLLSEFKNAIYFANSVECQLWIQNGGKETLENFFSYTFDFQKYVLNWLQNQPIVIPDLVVGQKKFYLAHAYHGIKWYDKRIKLSDVTKREADYVLWNRNYEKGIFPIYRPLGTTVIFGHTPASYFSASQERKIWRSESGKYIDIDCGCSNRIEPVLACLRLDDMREFYSTY